jgi:hypothetical protein
MSTERLRPVNMAKHAWATFKVAFIAKSMVVCTSWEELLFPAGTQPTQLLVHSVMFESARQAYT